VQGAVVSLSSSSLNFGNQTVGIPSSPQVVTLTNTGNIALTLAIAVIGTNSTDFSQTNTCGTSVSAGGNCTISVTFTPSAAGTRTAAVSITDNAPGSPQSVSLTGVGVLPAVTFSPSSLTFPTQVVFTTSKAKTVTLTNAGLGILTIKSIAASGPFAQPLASAAIEVCAGAVLSGSSYAEHQTAGALPQPTDNTDPASQRLAVGTEKAMRNGYRVFEKLVRQGEFFNTHAC